MLLAQIAEEMEARERHRGLLSRKNKKGEKEGAMHLAQIAEEIEQRGIEFCLSRTKKNIFCHAQKKILVTEIKKKDQRLKE